MYALELLTIYAWETGTEEKERFRLDKGLVTVLLLLTKYQRLCIYWTKYYTLQNPVIEDFVRNQLKEKRYWVVACQPHLRERELRERWYRVSWVGFILYIKSLYIIYIFKDLSILRFGCAEFCCRTCASPTCGERGLPSSCGSEASRCRGFS